MELSLLFSFFLFMLFILDKLVQGETVEYNQCKNPFSCGNNHVNLTYPFYDGHTRPSYCGYPGFQIDCSKNYPEISMSSQTYYLLTMNETSDTISVAMQNYYDGECPTNLFNIDLSLYSYATTNENITIFYGCSIPTLAPLAPQLPCRNATDNSDQIGYWMIQNSVSSQNLTQKCHSSVVLPAKIQSESQLNQNIPSNGFGLEWIAQNDLCDGCRGSGGQCGYNATLSRFMCYCVNGSFDYDCYGHKSSSKSNKGVIVGISTGGGLVAAVLVVCIVLARRRKRRTSQTITKNSQPSPASLSTDGLPRTNGFQSSEETKDSITTSTSPLTNQSQSMPSSYPTSNSELDNISSYHGVHLFSYSELEKATDNFSESRQLGDGGFGVVYYGELDDGRKVAVKRLFENSLKRMGQFMNEVTILADLRHDNLVTLHGCTSKRSRDLLLVYEYIPNGTVADHLHGKLYIPSKLTCSNRLNIAIETAEALSFLHDHDVIHRDVKTNNILLDNDLKVKVADFGLSRLFPNDVTHVSTAPQGTPGYVDPDYYTCFRLTEKSDVYSFGVVLIELISSKMAVDGNRNNRDINLAIMAVDRIQNHAISELVDPYLGFNEDIVVQKMVKLMVEVAFQCLQADREMRPSMKQVVESLRGIQKEMGNEQVVVDIQESDGDDVFLLKNDVPFSPEIHVNDRQ